MMVGVQYNTIFLKMPNITVKRCTVLNPDTSLPTEGDGEPHDCVVVTNEICSPRPDLQVIPVQNAEIEVYVDGSAFRNKQAKAA